MYKRQGGRIIRSLGWKEIYQEGFSEEEDTDDTAPRDQKLPEVKQGTVFEAGQVTITSGKTKPPARFTEAILHGGQ